MLVRILKNSSVDFFNRLAHFYLCSLRVRQLVAHRVGNSTCPAWSQPQRSRYQQCRPLLSRPQPCWPQRCRPQRSQPQQSTTVAL